MMTHVVKAMSTLVVGGALLLASTVAHAVEYRSPMERFFYGLQCDLKLGGEIPSTEDQFFRCVRLYRRLESMQERWDDAEVRKDDLEARLKSAEERGKSDTAAFLEERLDRVQGRIDRLADNLFPYHDDQ